MSALIGRAGDSPWSCTTRAAIAFMMCCLLMLLCYDGMWEAPYPLDEARVKSEYGGVLVH